MRNYAIASPTIENVPFTKTENKHAGELSLKLSGHITSEEAVLDVDRLAAAFADLERAEQIASGTLAGEGPATHGPAADEVHPAPTNGKTG